MFAIFKCVLAFLLDKTFVLGDKHIGRLNYTRRHIASRKTKFETLVMLEVLPQMARAEERSPFCFDILNNVNMNQL